MSLLTIIQRVTPRLGLSKPASVVGNTDSQVMQLLELANEEGEELASRFNWQALVKENTFTISTGSRDQGALNSAVVSAGDFDYLLNDTIWNRTNTEIIWGPLDAVNRQTYKAFPVTGPYQRFWIQGGNLYLDPAPTSADSAAFEYKSTHWCESSGGTGQDEWSADTDVGRLDENLMRLGLLWRWKQAKGLDYAQEFDAYEMRVADAMGRDGGAPRLRMDSGPFDRLPGIFVPQGSWNP